MILRVTSSLQVRCRLSQVNSDRSDSPPVFMHSHLRCRMREARQMSAILSIDRLDTCEAADGSLHKLICHRQSVSIPALPHCTHACVICCNINRLQFQRDSFMCQLSGHGEVAFGLVCLISGNVYPFLPSQGQGRTVRRQRMASAVDDHAQLNV